MNYQALRCLVESGVFSHCERVINYMVENYGDELKKKRNDKGGINCSEVERLFRVASLNLKLDSLDFCDVNIYCKFNEYDGLIECLEKKLNIGHVNKSPRIKVFSLRSNNIEGNV